MENRKLREGYDRGYVEVMGSVGRTCDVTVIVSSDKRCWFEHAAPAECWDPAVPNNDAMLHGVPKTDVVPGTPSTAVIHYGDSCVAVDLKRIDINPDVFGAVLSGLFHQYHDGATHFRIVMGNISSEGQGWYVHVESVKPAPPVSCTGQTRIDGGDAHICEKCRWLPTADGHACCHSCEQDALILDLRQQ